VEKVTSLMILSLFYQVLPLFYIDVVTITWGSLPHGFPTEESGNVVISI
jgi:hypothetical protein